MANQRSPDQKLLPFTAKVKFIAALDSGLRQLHISNRSQFIREAIQEKLARLGVVVPPELVAAEDRLGKGGPKPKTSSGPSAVQNSLLKMAKKNLKSGAPAPKSKPGAD